MKIIVEVSNITDKQAMVLFLQALAHKNKLPKVKAHTYELKSVWAKVTANKTIQVRDVKND